MSDEVYHVTLSREPCNISATSEVMDKALSKQHTFCASMTKARGLKMGLKSSFFPPAWEGGGTARAWEESSTAEALTSFSARFNHASKKSTQLPAWKGEE